MCGGIVVGGVDFIVFIYERFVREGGILFVVNWRRGMVGIWEGDDFFGV